MPGGGGGGICDSVEGGGGVGHPFWRRISNSVHYQSPVFGGAQIKVAYQTNQDKSAELPRTGLPRRPPDPSMWSASVTWAGMGGRLRIGAAYDSHDEFTTVGETDDGWRVVGGWNFGFADIGVAYEQMTYKTPGVIARPRRWHRYCDSIGQGAIRGAYSQADDIDGTFGGAGTCGAVGAGDNGAEAVQHRLRLPLLQAHHGRRRLRQDRQRCVRGASPGAAVERDDGQSVTPPAGSDVEIFFVSMIHRF